MVFCFACLNNSTIFFMLQRSKVYLEFLQLTDFIDHFISVGDDCYRYDGNSSSWVIFIIVVFVIVYIIFCWASMTLKL